MAVVEEHRSSMDIQAEALGQRRTPGREEAGHVLCVGFRGVDRGCFATPFFCCYVQVFVVFFVWLFFF